MVTQKPSKHVKASHGHVKIKAYHAKTYRDQVMNGLTNSQSFVSDLFVQDKTYDTQVRSTYGFSLSYDQKEFYSSSSSNDSGDLYVEAELSQERPYIVLRLAPNFRTDDKSVTTNSALTLTYHPTDATSKGDPESVALKDGGLDAANLTEQATTSTTIGGEVFNKTNRESKASSIVAPQAPSMPTTSETTLQPPPPEPTDQPK